MPSRFRWLPLFAAAVLSSVAAARDNAPEPRAAQACTVLCNVWRSDGASVPAEPVDLHPPGPPSTVAPAGPRVPAPVPPAPPRRPEHRLATTVALPRAAAAEVTAATPPAREAPVRARAERQAGSPPSAAQDRGPERPAAAGPTPVGAPPRPVAATTLAVPRSTMAPIAGSARIVEAVLLDSPDRPTAPADRRAAPPATGLPPAFDVIAFMMLAAPVRR